MNGSPFKQPDKNCPNEREIVGDFGEIQTKNDDPARRSDISDDVSLRDELLSLLYGILDDDEAETLRNRIATDAVVAVVFDEVRQFAEKLAIAAKCPESEFSKTSLDFQQNRPGQIPSFHINLTSSSVIVPPFALADSNAVAKAFADKKTDSDKQNDAKLDGRSGRSAVKSNKKASRKLFFKNKASRSSVVSNAKFAPSDSVPSSDSKESSISNDVFFEASCEIESPSRKENIRRIGARYYSTLANPLKKTSNIVLQKIKRRKIEYSFLTVGLTLFFIILAGFLGQRVQLQTRIARELRVLVAAPSLLSKNASQQVVRVNVSDVEGRPKSVPVRLAFFDAESCQRLLAHTENTDYRGVLRYEIPTSALWDSQNVRVEIVAGDENPEIVETAIPVVADAPPQLFSLNSNKRFARRQEISARQNEAIPAYASPQKATFSKTLGDNDNPANAETMDAMGGGLGGSTSGTGGLNAMGGGMAKDEIRPNVDASSSGRERNRSKSFAASPAVEPSDFDKVLSIDSFDETSIPNGVPESVHFRSSQAVSNLITSSDSASDSLSPRKSSARDDSEESTLETNERRSDGIYNVPAFANSMKSPPIVSNESGVLAERSVETTSEANDALEISAPAIRFYPENGVLVAGIENRVWLTTTNENGEPCSVSGQIQDDRGNVLVESVSSNESGLGYFALTPDCSTDYFWTSNEPFEKIERVPLGTVVSDLPLTFQVAKVVAPGEPIRGRFQAFKKKLPVVVAVEQNGILLEQFVLTTLEKTTPLEIPLEKNVFGTLKISVYNAEKSPYETLLSTFVFRRPPLSVQAKIEPTSNLAESKVDLSIFDVAKQEPSPSRLSICVCDAQNDALGLRNDLARSLESDESLELLLGTLDDSVPSPSEANGERRNENRNVLESEPLLFDNLVDLRTQIYRKIFDYQRQEHFWIFGVVLVGLLGGSTVVLVSFMTIALRVSRHWQTVVPTMFCGAFCVAISLFMLTDPTTRILSQSISYSIHNMKSVKTSPDRPTDSSANAAAKIETSNFDDDAENLNSDDKSSSPNPNADETISNAPLDFPQNPDDFVYWNSSARTDANGSFSFRFRKDVAENVVIWVVATDSEGGVGCFRQEDSTSDENE